MPSLQKNGLIRGFLSADRRFSALVVKAPLGVLLRTAKKSA